jgi:hypothetical protein
VSCEDSPILATAKVKEIDIHGESDRYMFATSAANAPIGSWEMESKYSSAK